MTETTRQVKSGFRGIPSRLILGIAIPFAAISGLMFAHPLYSVQIPTLATLKDSRPPANPFANGLMEGNDTGITDEIRNVERISLFSPTVFKRIAKIHQILSLFHYGLSVEDEERHSELIYHESLRYGYDPELIVSVILTESSFYTWAHSRKGAIGLMQIIPITGQELAEINQTPLHSAQALYDPHLNVTLGIQYLALLHRRFGDLGLALTAYNYGPTRVAEWRDRGEHLPQGYTRKILRQYEQLLYENPIALPAGRQG